MKEQTPKPCPFCGNRALGVSSWKTDERVKQAVACHCGATGPYAKSYKDAVAAWNRRMGVEVPATDSAR